MYVSRYLSEKSKKELRAILNIPRTRKLNRYKFLKIYLCLLIRNGEFKSIKKFYESTGFLTNSCLRLAYSHKNLKIIGYLVSLDDPIIDKQLNDLLSFISFNFKIDYGVVEVILKNIRIDADINQKHLFRILNNHDDKRLMNCANSSPIFLTLSIKKFIKFLMSKENCKDMSIDIIFNYGVIDYLIADEDEKRLVKILKGNSIDKSRYIEIIERDLGLKNIGLRAIIHFLIEFNKYKILKEIYDKYRKYIDKLSTPISIKYKNLLDVDNEILDLMHGKYSFKSPELYCKCGVFGFTKYWGIYWNDPNVSLRSLNYLTLKSFQYKCTTPVDYQKTKDDSKIISCSCGFNIHSKYGSYQEYYQTDYFPYEYENILLRDILIKYAAACYHTDYLSCVCQYINPTEGTKKLILDVLDELYDDYYYDDKAIEKIYVLLKMFRKYVYDKWYLKYLDLDIQLTGAINYSYLDCVVYTV